MLTVTAKEMGVMMRYRETGKVSRIPDIAPISSTKVLFEKTNFTKYMNIG
jgi:hypothetical protein